MIAQLSQLSDAAEPTAFHRFLHSLDERRRLLRVFTQNIDALEEKSGLTFGVPDVDLKRYKPRSAKGKVAATAPSDRPTPDEPSTSRLPSPPMETPRCIPLHGTLQLMHCQTCRHSFPLKDYIDFLSSGTPPPCPQCTALEETRQLIGKRSRGVGRLRPSVVLYNEDHKDGEEVGNVVQKDLMGSSKGKGRAGADLLLVVGTSLRVPGTKRIVREFSKAVRSRHAAMNAPVDEPSTSAHGLVTPTPSPRRSPAADEEPPIRTIYLNLDFPVPTREWDGVFDVWIRGDAQEFARLVQEEMEREEQAKEAARERKRKREEAAEMARQAEEQEVALAVLQAEEQDVPVQAKKRRRKEQPSAESGKDAHPSTAKKRKMGGRPLSPVSPPSKATHKHQKGKEKSKVRKHKTGALPSPPVSKDDRLVIKLPSRTYKQVPEVVIATSPTKARRPVPSAGRPPPASSSLSSPLLPSSQSTSTPARALALASSPLSSPPLSACPSSPYNMSLINDTLSEICSSPLSSVPPSPPKPARTMSSTTHFSSPLSSAPSSPYPQEISPPPSPSPSPTKRRKVGSPPDSARGRFMGHRPGTRPNQRCYVDFSENAYRDILTRDDEDTPPSESRLPESYVRTELIDRRIPVR